MIELQRIEPQSWRVELPQIQLAGLTWAGGGSPILMLHGLGDCAKVWQGIGSRLASVGYTCLAPDLRGHGDSDKPEQGYSGSDLAADLEALINHFDLSQVVIMTHSWAARVATVLATIRPEQVQALILIDPFFVGQLPRWLEWTFPILYRTLPFLKLMGPFARSDQAEACARKLKQYRGWSLDQEAAFRANLECRSDGSWGSKFAVQARDQVFADILATTGLTQSLRVPTLLILPDGGLNRMAWQLNPYRRYLAQLQIRSIPGHHWAFLVDPTPVETATLEFLNTLIDESKPVQFE